MELSGVSATDGQELKIDVDFSAIKTEFETSNPDVLLVTKDTIEVTKNFITAPEPILTDNSDGTATLTLKNITKDEWKTHKKFLKVELRATYDATAVRASRSSFVPVLNLNSKFDNATEVDGDGGAKDLQVTISQDEIASLVYGNYDNAIEVSVSEASYFVLENSGKDKVTIKTPQAAANYTIDINGTKTSAVNIEVGNIVEDNEYKINVTHKAGGAIKNTAEYIKIAEGNLLTQIADLSEWDFAVGDTVEVTVIDMYDPTIPEKTSNPITMIKAPAISSSAVKYDKQPKTLSLSLAKSVGDTPVNVTYSVDYLGSDDNIDNIQLAVVASGTLIQSNYQDALRPLAKGDVMTITTSQNIWNVLPNSDKIVEPTAALSVKHTKTTNNSVEFFIEKNGGTNITQYDAYAYILRKDGTKDYVESPVQIADEDPYDSWDRFDSDGTVTVDLTKTFAKLNPLANGDKIGLEIRHKTDGLIHNTYAVYEAAVEETKNEITWDNTSPAATKIKFTVEEADKVTGYYNGNLNSQLQLGFAIHTMKDEAIANTQYIPLNHKAGGVKVTADKATPTTAVVEIDLTNTANPAIVELKKFLNTTHLGKVVAAYVDNVSSLQTPKLTADAKEIQQVVTPTIKITEGEKATAPAKGEIEVALGDGTSIEHLNATVKLLNPAEQAAAMFKLEDADGDKITDSYRLANDSIKWEQAIVGEIVATVSSNEWNVVPSAESNTLEITHIAPLTAESNVSNTAITVTLTEDADEYIDPSTGKLLDGYEFSIAAINEPIKAAFISAEDAKFREVPDTNANAIDARWTMGANNTATITILSSDLQKIEEHITNPLNFDYPAITSVKSDEQSYHVMQINYNRAIDMKEAILTIVDKETPATVYVKETLADAKSSTESFFQWPFRNAGEKAMTGAVESKNDQLLEAGTEVTIKITATDTNDVDHEITQDYIVTEEDVAAATYKGVSRWTDSMLDKEIAQDVNDFIEREAYNNKIEFTLGNYKNWLEKASKTTAKLEELTAYVPIPKLITDFTDLPTISWTDPVEETVFADYVFVEIPSFYMADNTENENLSLTLYKTKNGAPVDTADDAKKINSAEGLVVIANGAVDPAVINLEVKQKVGTTTAIVKIPIATLEMVNGEEGADVTFSVSHSNPNFKAQKCSQKLTSAKTVTITEDKVDREYEDDSTGETKVAPHIEVTLNGGWDDTVRKVAYTINNVGATEFAIDPNTNIGYINTATLGDTLNPGDTLHIAVYGNTWNTIPSGVSKAVVAAPAFKMDDLSADLPALGDHVEGNLNIADDGTLKVTFTPDDTNPTADYSSITTTIAIANAKDSDDADLITETITMNGFVANADQVYHTKADLIENWSATKSGDVVVTTSSTKWYIIDNESTFTDAIKETSLENVGAKADATGIEVTVNNADDQYVASGKDELNKQYELHFSSANSETVSSKTQIAKGDWDIITTPGTATTTITNEELRELGIVMGHYKVAVTLRNTDSWVEKDKSIQIALEDLEEFVPKATFAKADTEADADFVVIDFEGAWKGDAFDNDFQIDLFVETAEDAIKTAAARVAHADLAAYLKQDAAAGGATDAEIAKAKRTAKLELPVGILNLTDADLNKKVIARVTHIPSIYIPDGQSSATSLISVVADDTALTKMTVPEIKDEVTGYNFDTNVADVTKKNAIEVTLAAPDATAEVIAYVNGVEKTAAKLDPATAATATYIEIAKLGLKVGDILTVEAKAADWRKLPAKSVESEKVTQIEKPVLAIAPDPADPANGTVTLTKADTDLAEYEIADLTATLTLKDDKGVVIETQEITSTATGFSATFDTFTNKDAWKGATTGSVEAIISNSKQWYNIDSESISRTIKDVATIEFPPTWEAAGLRVNLETSPEEYLNDQSKLGHGYKLSVTKADGAALDVPADLTNLYWRQDEDHITAIIPNSILLAALDDAIAFKLKLENTKDWFMKEKITKEISLDGEAKLVPQPKFVTNYTDSNIPPDLQPTTSITADHMLIEIPGSYDAANAKMNENLTVRLYKIADGASVNADGTPVDDINQWIAGQYIELVTDGTKTATIIPNLKLANGVSDKTVAYLQIPVDDLKFDVQDYLNEVVVTVSHTNTQLTPTEVRQKLQLAPAPKIVGTKEQNLAEAETAPLMYNSKMKVTLNDIDGEFKLDDNTDWASENLTVKYSAETPVVDPATPAVDVDIEFDQVIDVVAAADGATESGGFANGEKVYVEVASTDKWYVINNEVDSLATIQTIGLDLAQTTDGKGIVVTIENSGATAADEYVGVYTAFTPAKSTGTIPDSDGLVEFGTLKFEQGVDRKIKATITENDLKKLKILPNDTKIQVTVSHAEDWLLLNSADSQIDIPSITMAKPIVGESEKGEDFVRIEVPGAVVNEHDDIINLDVTFEDATDTNLKGDANTILDWTQEGESAVANVPRENFVKAFENNGGTVTLKVVHQTLTDKTAQTSFAIPPTPLNLLFTGDNFIASVNETADAKVKWQAEVGITADDGTFTAYGDAIESAEFSETTGSDPDPKYKTLDGTHKAPEVMTGDKVTIRLVGTENASVSYTVPVTLSSPTAVEAPTLDVTFSASTMTVKIPSEELGSSPESPIAEVQYIDNPNVEAPAWKFIGDSQSAVMDLDMVTTYTKAIATIPDISTAALRVAPKNSATPFIQPNDDLINDDTITIDAIEFEPTSSAARAVFRGHTLSVMLRDFVNPNEITMTYLVDGAKPDPYTPLEPIMNNKGLTYNYTADIPSVDIPAGESIRVDVATAEGSSTYYKTVYGYSDKVEEFPTPSVTFTYVSSVSKDHFMMNIDSYAIKDFIDNLGEDPDDVLELTYKTTDANGNVIKAGDIAELKDKPTSYFYLTPNNDILPAGGKLHIIATAVIGDVTHESVLVYERLQAPTMRREKGTIVIDKNNKNANVKYTIYDEDASKKNLLGTAHHPVTIDNNELIIRGSERIYNTPIAFKRLPDFNTNKNLEVFISASQDGFMPIIVTDIITPNDVIFKPTPTIQIEGNTVSIKEYNQYASDGTEVYIAIREDKLEVDDIEDAVEASGANINDGVGGTTLEGSLKRDIVYKYTSAAGYPLDTKNENPGQIQILVKNENYKDGHELTATHAYTQSDIGQLKAPRFVGVEGDNLIILYPDDRAEFHYYAFAKAGAQDAAVAVRDDRKIDPKNDEDFDPAKGSISIATLQKAYTEQFGSTNELSAGDRILVASVAEGSVELGKTMEYTMEESDFPMPAEIESFGFSDGTNHWVDVTLNKVPIDHKILVSKNAFTVGSTVTADGKDVFEIIDTVDEKLVSFTTFDVMRKFSVANTDEARKALAEVEDGLKFALVDADNKVIDTNAIAFTLNNMELAPLETKKSGSMVHFLSTSLDEYLEDEYEIQVEYSNKEEIEWEKMPDKRGTYQVSESIIFNPYFEARIALYNIDVIPDPNATTGDDAPLYTSASYRNPATYGTINVDGKVIYINELVQDKFDEPLYEEIPLFESEFENDDAFEAPEIEIPEVMLPSLEIPEMTTPEMPEINEFEENFAEELELEEALFEEEVLFEEEMLFEEEALFEPHLGEESLENPAMSLEVVEETTYGFVLESAPIEEYAAEEAVLESAPIEEYAAEEAVLESAPIEEYAAEEAVLESAPIEEYAVEEAVLESVAIEEYAVEEFVAEEFFEEPVAEEIFEEPVAEEVFEEPVAEEVFEEPVVEEVFEEPVAEEVFEEPVAEEVFEEPVAEEIFEEPVAEEVFE
ncbi:hypothetical protein [Candidatus Epulonipiscium viviparus]|uniref:hypothetical protein n=1 Tax=Candidatus Epulonipiscium viviparus TaxID=420336 RepID=UPI00273809E7|nr:hypothetical protein [Candidatus Epulopiscium viviparus]